MNDVRAGGAGGPDQRWSAPANPSPPGPHGRGRVREFVAAALWVLLAVLWALAVVLPWYSEGILSSTSLLDFGQVLRSDVLPVPGATGFGVLVLPGLGAVLVAIALARGITALMVRLVALLVGTGLVITLIVLLSEVGVGAWASGLWSAILGCLSGVAALALSTVRTGTSVEPGVAERSDGVLAGPYAPPPSGLPQRPTQRPTQ